MNLKQDAGRGRPDLQLYPEHAREPQTIKGETMIRPIETNGSSDDRNRRVITVRLDQPTRDRMSRRIPTDYRTVSALVRAGIDEVLTNRRSADRRELTDDGRRP